MAAVVNSYIAETGTGALIFRSNNYSFRNSANTEQVMLASENGAVVLYHDNSAKLATSSAGVDVTGTLSVSVDIDVNGVDIGRGGSGVVSNTALGTQTLANNSTGSGNSATGLQALYSNTTGSNNSASGYRAIYFNTTGSSNTATGRQALYSNTTGRNNSAHGYSATYFNTTGLNNAASCTVAI